MSTTTSGLGGHEGPHIVDIRYLGCWFDGDVVEYEYDYDDADDDDAAGDDDKVDDEDDDELASTLVETEY